MFGDKEIGKEYDSAQGHVDVNGKLVYIAEKDSKSFIVYDGKEIDKESQYDFVGSIVNIGEKIAYIAGKRDGSGSIKSFIVYDGREFGKEYDSADAPVNLNGKLAYRAKKDKKHFIVYDGKEIGKEYDSAYSPLLIKGKLTFMAKDIDEKNGGKYFIVQEK